MFFYNSTANKLYLEEAKQNNIYLGDINISDFTIPVSEISSIVDKKIRLSTSLPSWIYAGRNIMFTLEYGGEFEYLYGRAISVFSDVDNSEYWFTIDKPLTFPTDFALTRITGVQNISTEGLLERDAMGNNISSVLDINSQKIISCTDIAMEEGKGLLLYDRHIQNLSGTFSLSNTVDNTRIQGFDSKLLTELKKGDYVYINNKYNKIKKVIDNTTAILEIGVETDFVQINISLISNPETDMESIIYSTYDTLENKGVENYMNVFSIRPNREINYIFNVSEIDGEFTGQTIVLDELLLTEEIYKIWVNGELLSPIDYIKSGKNVFLRDTKKLRTSYNYYICIKYNPSTKNGINDNHATLNYYGYDTNFLTKEEYFKNLYIFMHHDNLSEDMSNNYAELSEKFTNVKRRILKSTTNRISFDSKIGKRISSNEEKYVTDDISELISNLYNFRLIKVVGDNADKIVIYTNCQMPSPPVEKTDLTVSQMSYNIDFKNKIVFADRLFGEGAWGRFNPFGLKQISNTNRY